MPKGLKAAIDFGPLVLFLGVYWARGLLPATATLMAATVAALVVSFVVTRKVSPMPLATAVIVGVFGGLTLWLDDDTFIKMKPTIVYGLFAAVIGGGLAMGKPAAKVVLGEAFQLTDEGWKRLSLRFCLFFVAMALANEAVRRVAPLDVWVLWKFPGSLVITAAFMVAQVRLVERFKLD